MKNIQITRYGIGLFFVQLDIDTNGENNYNKFCVIESEIFGWSAHT